MPVAARAIPGPSRAEMEAAYQLPKGQQDAMIQGMVAGLAAKPQAAPADADRWIMLLRSRRRLGQTAKASDRKSTRLHSSHKCDSRMPASTWKKIAGSHELYHTPPPTLH